MIPGHPAGRALILLSLLVSDFLVCFHWSNLLASYECFSEECQKTLTTTTSQKSIAIHLQFVLQHAPNLYGSAFGATQLPGKGNTVSTPPICIAVRLPFVSEYASHLYRNTFGKIQVVVVTGMFPRTFTSASKDPVASRLFFQPAPCRGLSGPLGPKCRKSLENVSRGPQKVSKKSREQSGKSRESLRKVSGECFWSVFGVFGDFLGFRGEAFSRLFRHFGPGGPAEPL